MLKAEEIRTKVAQEHEAMVTPYYRDAEARDRIEVFWGKDSIFSRLFDKLDLSDVVELACGHGRHTAQCFDRARLITLVDILQTNINFCEHRFKTKPNVSYVVNNGHDLSGLQTSRYTSVFSYDAMVHFEATDVISYIYEISRVLKKGGRALLHYSNNEDFPEGTYKDDPAWRSFFSEKMMRHFANRAGFRILESQTISWPPANSSAKHIDAITLLEKFE